MGRQLERQDSEIEFQRYHPGCMWGLFHILDHHHLQSLKKRPPRRKHGRGNRDICCTNPKTVSFEHFPEEVHEYLDAEAVPLLVEPERRSPSRFSSNTPVKGLETKEVSARLPLNRTASIHHLEPSGDRFATRRDNWANPIIILHTSGDDSSDFFKQEQKTTTTYSHASEKNDKFVKRSVNQNLLGGGKHLDRGISCPQFDYTDVLEIFKVNKKLFMEIQEDPDIKVEKQWSFRAKARLKKSGSFPAPVSSNIGPVKPTTLEHKQKEVWYVSKGEKLSPGVQAQENYPPKASKDSYGKSQVLKADTSGDALVSQDRNVPPTALSQGSHKHGWPHWHHSVTARIKYIKRKIKHVLKEGRKESNPTSRDAVHQRVSVGSELFAEEKDLDDSLEITSERVGMETLQSSQETKGSDDALVSVVQKTMRTSSLNESMDRYTRLFESTISKETKWSQYQSKSLKLTNEDKPERRGNGLKSFRRRLSLSDLDSFVSFPNEVFRDAFSSELPKGYDINDDRESQNEFKPSSNHLGRQQFELTNVIEEARPQEGQGNLGDNEGISKTVEVHDSVAETEKLEPRPNCCDEICLDSIKEQEIDANFQDYTAAATELLATENLNGGEHMNTGESDYSVTVEDLSCRDSAGRFQDIANRECDENANIMAENHSLPYDFGTQDDDDFNYVRDVLEVAGFNEEDCLGKWHSLDQPMSSTLFKEMEVFLHGQCLSDDTVINCNHRLLFDLINEELLDIHERSLAYFPEPFSFATRRFKPIPKGNHLIEQVWKRIDTYQKSYTDEESLDDIVGRDLEKHDGWTNLQFDVEDVALDLEDLIFDDLLDEVISL